MKSGESLYGITAHQKIDRLRETVKGLQTFGANSSEASDQPVISNTQRVVQCLPDLLEVLGRISQQEGRSAGGLCCSAGKIMLSKANSLTSSALVT